MVGPLIVSISGRKLLAEEKLLLSHPKVGGLVLFRENYDENAENPKEDLKFLIQEIRTINPNIVIMVDHEGGKVWRFIKGFTKLPPAKEYGELYSTDKNAALTKALQDGYTMAKELLECGIDLSLAPVVDLDGPSNVIGKILRAYDKDPNVVIEIASEFIKGMNQAGMAATLKHFPGHGSCALDSHISKPLDERPIVELQKDLQPFQKLISNPELVIGTVMSNFVTYPQIDSENVAAFSKKLLQEKLRVECKFNGIIMSDCLHMKGADVGENLARLQAAQSAGNDFLMYTHQHGEKLDNLLSILDQIPDTQEAAERRIVLLTLIKKNRFQEHQSKSLLPGYNIHKEETYQPTVDNPNDVEQPSHRQHLRYSII